MFRRKVIEEKEFDLYATNIKQEVGVDIFENKRTLKHVVWRAMFCYIVKDTYPETTLHGIKRMFNKRGKKYDHATVLHALKCFHNYISPKYGLKYSQQREILNTNTLQDLLLKVKYVKGTLEDRKSYCKKRVDTMNTYKLEKLEQYFLENE